MSSKILPLIYAVICITSSLEAASLRKAKNKDNTAMHKLDYEGMQADIRSSRQVYQEYDSNENSDEYNDDENVIRQQSVEDSEESNNEDDINNDEEDEDDDYFGRRIKRDISKTVNSSEISPDTEVKENPPVEEASTSTSPIPPITGSSSDSSTTSVLILIRDAIKKVTELPDTQQVATSAQQYFQLLEHFLQQTIEQVIGDDDDEDEIPITTIVPEQIQPEGEKESESETSHKEIENTDKSQNEVESSDKQNSSEHEVPKGENN